jgi:hypothetical protein
VASPVQAGTFGQPVATSSGTVSGFAPGGMPRAACRMRAWQYRKAAASSAASGCSSGHTTAAAAQPSSSGASAASRDIHAGVRVEQHVDARQGRPISAHTHSSPRHQQQRHHDQRLAQPALRAGQRG